MRARGLAAVALCILAGILLAYGGTLLYVKQELGREKSFAARLVSSLDDPDVRGVVTERTVDALEAGPASDLLPFRPLVLAAAAPFSSKRSTRPVAKSRPSIAGTSAS